MCLSLSPCLSLSSLSLFVSLFCASLSSLSLSVTILFLLLRPLLLLLLRLLEARLDTAISPTLSPAELSPRSSSAGTGSAVSVASTTSPRDLEASLEGLRIDQSRPGRRKKRERGAER